MRWSERDLARIGAADEILVAPDRGDRSRGPAVPIWVVGDELYVRSHRGASGGWYRRARFSNGRIRSGGDEFRVRFNEVAAPELRAQIDKPYLVKYGRYGSSHVTPMTSRLRC
jgi:hypothetical protein